jgi:hypothetical protein
MLEPRECHTEDRPEYVILICRNHRFALFINFCIRNKTLTMTGWVFTVGHHFTARESPALHVKMLNHDSLVRSPSPSSPILQPSLTSSPHYQQSNTIINSTHQQSNTINNSTHQHVNIPPTHRRNSASPYIRANSAAPTSQKRQASTPMEHFGFQPPPKLATLLPAMTRYSNSHYVEENVHSRSSGRG